MRASDGHRHGRQGIRQPPAVRQWRLEQRKAHGRVRDDPEDPDVRHLIDDFATQLSLVDAGDLLAERGS